MFKLYSGGEAMLKFLYFAYLSSFTRSIDSGLLLVGVLVSVSSFLSETIG